jgi:DNA primase
MAILQNNALEEIKGRADIVDIISEHVALKKSGRNWMGLCPFHPEKTPSFMVSADKGIFKCFGCGAGGDVFSFLQRINNQNFAQTLADLAARYGIKIDYSDEKVELKNLLIDINKAATKFYTESLFDEGKGKEARDYLHNRGITNEIIFQFNLGYAPEGWENLFKYLTKEHQYTAEVIEQAGLITKRANSEGYYDKFRDRIIVPIHNDRGQIIAFGGRTLKKDDQPKYLNSPETPVFHKGKNVYGLYQAKEAIKAEDCVILMEGYFDAISAHANGISNVVATLGTALTSDQLRILGKYTKSKRIFIAFDADLAGGNATDRGIEVIKNTFSGLGGIKIFDNSYSKDSVYEIRIITIPEEKDPDDYIRSKGAESFKRLVKTAPLLLDFQVEQILKANDLESATGKLKAIKELSVIFTEISSPIIRSEYIRTVSERLGVREEDFSTELNQLKTKKSNRNRHFEDNSPQITKRRDSKDFIKEAEKNLISLYFVKEEYWDLISSKLKEVQFLDTNHQLLKNSIEGYMTECRTIDNLTEWLTTNLADNMQAMETFSDIIFSLEDKLCMNNEEKINLFIKENLACISRFKAQSEEQKVKEEYYAAKNDEIKSLELQYQVKSLINSRLSTL